MLLGFPKIWIWHLVVSGVLAGLVLLQPALIVLGLFLFVLPGAILYIAPSLFLYSLALTLLLLACRPLGKARGWVATLLLLAAGFLIPLPGNQATRNRIAELTKGDIEVTGPIETGRSVAVIESSFRHSSRNGTNRCDSLCLRLLYDGVTERVLTGSYQQENESGFEDGAAADALPATAWFIERRDSCPSSFETLGRVSGGVAAGVSQRIAAGDCLIREETTLAEAETLYIAELVGHHKGYVRGSRYNLGAAPVSAWRRRVVERSAEGERTLYQKTTATARPLLYPLLFGGIPSGGAGLNMSLGFWRKEIVRNDVNFVKTEEPRIFGVMFNELQTSEDLTGAEARALVLKALQSDAPQRQAGHDFFPHYLASFSPRAGDLTPSPEDVDVVIRALADDRIVKFGALMSFNQKLERVPDALVVAMADRILKSADKDFLVKALSKAIRALPEGNAAAISGQLLEMLQDEQLAHLARDAVTRLGDGDPRTAAHYLSALEAWNTAEAFKYKGGGPQAVRGFLIGLCRMGNKAAEAKDTLLANLRDDESRLPSPLVINALLSMGALQDLQREYDGDEERTKEILEAVRRKEIRARQNQDVCTG